MKIRIEKNENFGSEPEVIIRCRDVDERVHHILSLLEEPKKRVIGYANHQEYVLDPADILYCESVDGIVFIYMQDNVYRTAYTLNDIENAFSNLGFFRCSKSMVINIYSIKKLKSELGNRIDAELSNREHIIISRHFAKDFRSILKEAGSL